jgi:hypothetical protein
MACSLHYISGGTRHFHRRQDTVRRHFLPRLCVVLLVPAVWMAAVVWLFNPHPGLHGLLVTAAMFAVSLLTHHFGVAGSVNTEMVGDVAKLGGEGRAGRALIVYDSLHRRSDVASIRWSPWKSLCCPGWPIGRLTLVLLGVGGIARRGFSCLCPRQLVAGFFRNNQPDSTLRHQLASCTHKPNPRLRDFAG